MSTMSLANALVSWYRSTSTILASVVVAASHVPDHQPGRKSVARVSLTGTPTGTVVVSGTVDGVSDSETLTWAGTAGARSTTKEFTAFTTFVTSLSGAVLIDVQAHGVDGQPQEWLAQVQSGYPVQIQDVTFPYSTILKAGTNATGAVRINVDWTDTWVPRIGDVVKDEGIADAIYRVTGLSTKRGSLGPSHWQVEANLNRSSLG